MKAIDRDSFILDNKGLVIKIANKYKFAIGKNIDFEDLVQLGMIGLIKAVDKNDSTKGYSFSTFAYPLIEGEIRNYLRDRLRTIRLPAHLNYLITRIVSQGKSHLEPQEIANEFGCSLGYAERAKLVVERGDATSLDVEVFDVNEPATLVDFVACDQDFSIMFVRDFLNSLSDKQRAVVLERLKGKSERAIGLELGVSRQWVHELKKQAATKLKEYMEVV